MLTCGREGEVEERVENEDKEKEKQEMDDMMQGKGISSLIIIIGEDGR